SAWERGELVVLLSSLSVFLAFPLCSSLCALCASVVRSPLYRETRASGGRRRMVPPGMRAAGLKVRFRSQTRRQYSPLPSVRRAISRRVSPFSLTSYVG